MANLMAQMQRKNGPIVANHEIQIGTVHDPRTILQSSTRSKCNTATMPKTMPDMIRYARAFILRPYRSSDGGQARELKDKVNGGVLPSIPQKV